ncbi:hypothetical protein BEL04_21340 [Mucilaginibacter sp. PPCGB 2223]|uniref:beta-1,6-N-acetylglucosaminyltransferase n=1 Tax=Mucilaginibacter sp. PPCGB 2223 TaxID=1886027 RepID=UPI0008244051|nr:beta-1,6-N-acetylglucosaminyltransferase [Mucilaginibacter sp. PPCGB 2223]OCX50334.1 hypothetical protein BEL04_21340 [Mucilaginibacter sp. PPCGB 2223]
MRLAHLLLIHNDPQQTRRLINRLHHAGADVYIHLDAKTDMAGFESLADIGNVFFIRNRVSVFWGNYSMIEAELNGFDEILATGKQYSHINLLSGQDYPLKSAGEIQQFLFANADKSFMRYFAIPQDWDEPVSRLQKHNFGDFAIPGKHQLQILANRFLPARKLPAGLQIYGRSQWFTITPAGAKFCIDYLKAYPKIQRFFKLTWAADELIFQTILLNSPLRDSVVNDHLRYIRFKRGDSRPHTLTLADVEILTASGKFYARKFDPGVDTTVMDALDDLAAKTKAG